ncbi:MAG: YdcF family protein [Polyangiales bacterium]
MTRSEGDTHGAWTQALGRGMALFSGGFSLLNVLGSALSPGYDANHWWIDLRPLPHLLSLALLGSAGALWVAHGLRAASGARRSVTFLATLFLLAVTASNAVTAVTMRLAGRIGGSSWVPFSLAVTLGLSAVLVSLSPDDEVQAPGPARVAAVVAVLALLAPLAQMFSFGRTDYRRPADLIVVFGARVYADGRPSQPVRDRVATAARLYRDGMAPRLLMSGGPGDGAVHETEAMRDLAARLGVPLRAIVRDPAGVDSQSTVRTATALCRERGWCRVLAVSHGYHLARVKMAFQRAGMHSVYTVPCVNTLGAVQARLMAREVAALWYYYLFALPRRGA